ncbi:MAG: efflux RND transporter periplasmic adaptor subunit [Sutterella sp.]|nr:efflux RND transporter periplasmic adaptor subunit [Sutterella sp.]MDD7427762.1 efflux RND transporter periplasmic adaptor subunit [Sutterella sp.]MDY3274029.1 efflux RND transporter periplasmic adaptor subunit [Duodenibacillus sp.]
MLFSTRSKILTLTFAAALAAGLTGCHKQAPVQGPHATPVGVQVAELSDEIVSSELPGRLTAYRTAEVRPQVTGIILKRLFEEGSQVQEGQSLYQIDPTLYKAAVAQATASVAQAEANLRLAKADAKRSTALLASKAVSEQADESAQAKYKVAQANLLAAKAALTTAQENLRYTEVKSPIPGRVSLSEVTPGALVTANQAARLTVVQQLDPIYMDVQQSYEALAKLKSQLATGYLKKGTNGEADVAITLADGQVYPYKGKLMFKDALVDETTGSVRLRAVFPNPDGTLLPGMFARAKAVDGVREKVIRISQKAVMRAQNGNPYVFVVNKSNRVESRDVVLHYADGTDWILEKGLSAGDVVIVDGTLRVRVNDLVSFKSDKAPAAPAAK